MTVISTSASLYRETQENYACANVLQSAELSQLQEDRGIFLKTERLLIKDDAGRLIGQAVVNYRKVKRFFTQAIVTQGPLVDYDNLGHVNQVITELVTYVKQQGADELIMHPHIVDTIKDENLTSLLSQQQAPVLELLTGLGFSHQQDVNDSFYGAGQVFRKPLAGAGTYQEVLSQLSPEFRRDLKRVEAYPVHIVDLPAEELEAFYEILYQTGQRKGFPVQDIGFFQLLKKHLGARAKFMLAYLDCKTYRQNLANQIAEREVLIAELLASPTADGVKAKRRIKAAEQEIASYRKRQQQLADLPEEQEKLCLSSYLFIHYGQELLSYMGGNLDDYFNFGGATLINMAMLRYALDQKLTYLNFGSTIETETADLGQGNFNYKRRFGGQLDIYLGTFSKSLNPFYGWLKARGFL